MKHVDSWWWPDGEQHMLQWMAHPKNRVILNGRPAYQGKKQQAVLQLCHRRRVAVDVGAHIGLWSFNLVREFDKVIAFEPVDEHRACFTRNVLAGLPAERTIDLQHCALGAEEGSVCMIVNPTSTGDSWVLGHGDIVMRTLDSYALPELDLLKIDCEGFEENVLRGAVETLQRCRPVVIVEQKRDMARKFGLEPQGGVRFLLELGWRQHAEIGGDFIMVPTQGPRLPEPAAAADNSTSTERLA